MAHSKFTLHKYIKLDDGSWRSKRAAFYANGKIKPCVVIVGKDANGKSIEETHAEGKYVMNHNGSWGTESRSGALVSPCISRSFALGYRIKPSLLIQSRAGA